ncbi:MAG: butyrate kinase, partial [Candidatus Adiutrix sp.]|nr:butyrate kinase [Candidatus Adiutrix sp.]
MIPVTFQQLADQVLKDKGPKTVAAVIAPEDAHTLEAVVYAADQGLVEPLLFGRKTAVKADIYDAVVVDELEDIARFTGVPQLTRRASCHVLNMRAVALKTAQKYGRLFQDLNFVVCHMGGGITATVISRGRMIDALTDEEGSFSPERAGGVPCRQLADLCYCGQYSRQEITKLMRGRGGLVAYLGANSALEVEKRIAAGDHRAELIYSAMAYQTAKGIGGLTTALKGQVDYIVLTGALARSPRFLDQVRERIGFIAP